MRLREFPGRSAVQRCVNLSLTSSMRERAGTKKRAQPRTAGSSFSFGSRRFASKGPRRLFVARNPLMSSVFEPQLERPHSLLDARLRPA